MTEESIVAVQKLVSIVARAFYSDRYVLALDFLNQRERAREDEIAKYLQIPVREIHKICGRLREEKLLRSQSRMEARRAEYRPISRTYYQLDYKLFVDVVKWRMWKLQQIVKSKMEVERSKLGFICPNCKYEYSTMQALSLVDFATGLFICEICSSVLEDNTTSDVSVKSQETLSQLMDQCNPILNALKQTDSLVLPQPTPFESFVPPELENGDPNSANYQGGGDAEENLGNQKSLNVAKDTGINTGDILVEFDCDLSPDQEMLEREQKLKIKQEQNAFPPWHVWSTVSGVQIVPDRLISASILKAHETKVSSGLALKSRRLVAYNNDTHDGKPYKEKNPFVNNASLLDFESDTEEAIATTDKKLNESFYISYYNDFAKKNGIKMSKKRKIESVDNSSGEQDYPLQQGQGQGQHKDQRYFDDIVNPKKRTLVTESSQEESINGEYNNSRIGGGLAGNNSSGNKLFSRILKAIESSQSFITVKGKGRLLREISYMDIERMTNVEYTEYWSLVCKTCSDLLQSRRNNNNISVKSMMNNFIYFLK